MPSEDVHLTSVLDARGGAVRLYVYVVKISNAGDGILLLSRTLLLNHLPNFFSL